jgi:pimeloyl-[acyl-carrier protein] methyl ester esterase
MLYSKTTGTGNNLVILHGWGLNCELFNALVDRYKDQYSVTVVDLPGHGQSDDVDGGIEEWCNEIIKVLPKNPTIMGWSLGGLIAIRIATKIKISKLVLVASTPKFVQSDYWKFGIDSNTFSQFFESLHANPSKCLKRFTSLQTNDKKQLKILNALIDNKPASIVSLEQGLIILLHTDLTQELANLEIPIEAILGTNDKLISNEIGDWFSSNNIATSELNTGHLPFLHPNFTLSI